MSEINFQPTKTNYLKAVLKFFWLLNTFFRKRFSPVPFVHQRQEMCVERKTRLLRRYSFYYEQFSTPTREKCFILEYFLLRPNISVESFRQGFGTYFLLFHKQEVKKESFLQTFNKSFIYKTSEVVSSNFIKPS